MNTLVRSTWWTIAAIPAIGYTAYLVSQFSPNPLWTVVKVVLFGLVATLISILVQNPFSGRSSDWMMWATAIAIMALTLIFAAAVWGIGVWLRDPFQAWSAAQPNEGFAVMATPLILIWAGWIITWREGKKVKTLDRTLAFQLEQYAQEVHYLRSGNKWHIHTDQIVWFFEHHGRTVRCYYVNTKVPNHHKVWTTFRLSDDPGANAFMIAEAMHDELKLITPPL